MTLLRDVHAQLVAIIDHVGRDRFIAEAPPPPPEQRCADKALLNSHAAAGTGLQQALQRPAHADLEGIRWRPAVRAATASGSRAAFGLTAGTACRSFHAGAIPNGKIPPISGPNFGAGSNNSHEPVYRHRKRHRRLSREVRRRPIASISIGFAH
jgi:hypothetical protein